MHTKTVISGIRWTLSTTILRRAISLILFIFLAKWLSQTDFGIYRSFSAILALLTYLTHFGLDYLYLVSRQKERVNLLALLQTGLLVSAVITVLLAVFGKNIGAYYHSAELGKVLSYGGGLIFIESLRRIVRVYTQKKFQFKDLALAETLNVIIYSVLCLALIYFWRYAWLFILLFYIGNLGELVYLCIKLPRIPSSLLKRVFSFSWLKKTFALFSHNSNFLLMVNAINLLQSYSINAPILFLGTLVEPALMGVYFFASQLIAIPVGMLNTSFAQVFFPVLAKSEKTASVAGIRHYTSLVLKIGIPALIVYALLLQYLVPVIWGDKWLSAMPLILYMVIYYGTSMLHNPISGIPFICKKPQWELLWNIITLCLRILVLYLGLQVNFAFAILLFCLVSAVMHFAFYYMSLALLKADLWQITIDILTYLPILFVLALGCLYMGKFSVVFPLVVLIGYFLYLLIAERDTLKEVLTLLKK